MPHTAAIQVGQSLQDNDPRVTYRRVLTIEALEHDAAGRLAKVQAREGVGGRSVHIAANRIHTDGRPRRTGFSLVQHATEDPFLASLVGKDIVLRRGSDRRAEGPGKQRTVLARLDRVDGVNVFATLLEDDPWATTAPTKAGESGVWHGHSFVVGAALPATLSEGAFELLRAAVTLSKDLGTKNVAMLKSQLSERFPGKDAAIQEAVEYWAASTRDRHPA